MKRLVSTILIAVSIFSSGYADWMTSVSSTISLDLDLSSGVRDTYGEESLTFSSLWSEDASAVVRLASNGVSLMADQNGEGVLKWNEKTPGLYTLTHTTIKNGDATEVLTAQFAVILRTFDANVIVGYEGVYDGASHSTQSSIPEGARIVYSTAENGVYTEVKPTFITAGTYTVWYKITKSGYYEKAGSAEVKITPKTLTSSMVSLSGASGLVYDGTQKRPEVIVSDGGRITAYDYSVTYSNNVNPGMATVTIVGKRNYTGTVTKTFAIYQNVAVGGIHWAGEGDAGWTIESENPFSATSGSIGNSQKTTLIAAFSGLGKLSFKWKVSSETTYDKLTVIVDEVERGNISGTLGNWEDVQFDFVADGDHEIKWIYSKDGSGVKGDDRAWVKDVVFDSSYLVVFDANGGNGDLVSQKMTYGRAVCLMENQYHRPGYVFTGWSLTAGGVISYADGASVLNLAPVAEGIVTLYAKWSPNNYDILFDSNSGEGAMSPVSAKYDETLSLPENSFEKTGYTFVGWSVAPNGAVKYFDKQQVQNLSADERGQITLYAVWAKNLYECVLSGFISKYLTSSSLVFDTSTDIWDASATYVEEAEALYASSLASYTTVAYGTHMYMEKGVTYYFRGKYADYAAVKVDGSWVVPKSSSSGVAVSGSYTASSTGWRKVEFRVGNYTGTGGVLSSSYYGIQWKRSSESTWRNIEATGNWPLFTVAPPFVVKNDPADTTQTDSINGTAYIQYGKYEGEHDVSLWIDGTEVLCAEGAGIFTWQPTTTGAHEITWKSGVHTASLTVNVASVVGIATPLPNPPTNEDANITLTSTAQNIVAGGKTTTIVTKGTGTWSASASVDWITVKNASGKAGVPVACVVAATKQAEPRVGYVYVSGHVVAFTQAGVGAALDQNAAAFDTAGGDGTLTVVVDADVAWHARSNVDWISLAQTSGTGETELTYTVAPWNEVTTRTGTITAGGQTFTVNQTGRPMKLQTYDITRDYNGHVLDIQVNALAGAVWEIFLGNSWISIVDGGSGKGGDNVALAIAENPSYKARTGRVTIGTEELVIVQEGRPSSALSFGISPVATTASVNGANGMIAVTATPDLPWSATSAASWLTVMPGFDAGDGSGNVIYTVSPNPDMTERSGTITVMPVSASGLTMRTHTVTQPAATALVSIDSHAFAAAGESFDVKVTVDDGVRWSVSENVDWVSVTRTVDVGPGTVTIVVDPNMTIDARACEVVVAGHAFTVLQAGRTVEVEYTSKVFGTEGDVGTIEVHPDGAVDWTATVSDPTWIMIFANDDACSDDGSGSNVWGVGDGTIMYILSEYIGDGTPRTGWIDVGDKRVYLTQRAYELSINPIGEEVGGNTGSGRVSVPATIDQIWEAVATEPWITVSTVKNADGSGAVLFTYTENDTGAQRTGRIIIAGEEYTITQAARRLVTIDAECAGGKGIVAGGGRFDLGTSVTLTAMPQDDSYVFVNWTLPDGTKASGNSVTVVADVDKKVIANFRLLPSYRVNGEFVREGIVKQFVAPSPIVDAAGTTKIVCRGTSKYPNLGTSFSLKITEDVTFAWDVFETNYLLTVTSPVNGAIREAGQSIRSRWVTAGETVVLTATPNAGSTFFRWTGATTADTIDGNALSIGMDAPRTIGAQFGAWNDTLATAADAPGLVFTTGGDADWLPVVDATALAGVSSVCSGAIGDESETWLETTVAGAGMLTFNWRVDCEKDDGGEAEWDRLSVFTNGVEAARIDGKTAWQPISLSLSGEKTIVRWSFYRDDFDESPPGCEHCGRVDRVIFSQEGK